MSCLGKVEGGKFLGQTHFAFLSDELKSCIRYVAFVSFLGRRHFISEISPLFEGRKLKWKPIILLDKYCYLRAW